MCKNKMKKFIYPILLLVISYLVVGSIYDEITKDKTPGKAKRLECQKKVTTFEKSFDINELFLAQKQVESEKIAFQSHIEKPLYSPSVIEEYITLEQSDGIFQNALDSYFKAKNSIDNRYKFAYYIYENDKNNPGKKNKKSTLYAGYVVFDVKNDKNQTIYKVQIDFMEHNKNSIEQSLKCTVESFMTFM